jgi:hypothetical protein
MSIDLIGISGKLTSGKDTVASMIMSNSKDDWEIKKYSKKLKEIASILTGIPEENFEDQKFKNSVLPKEWSRKFRYPSYIATREEDMTVRRFLQLLGTEAIREGLHTNAWVNALFADCQDEDPPWFKAIKFSKWIVTDVRFPNEFDGIKQRGGIVIRVNRPGINTGDHPSETALDNHVFDYTITNDGTLEELEQKVITMLNTIK